MMITPAASIAVPTPRVTWLAPATATPCPGGRAREAVAEQDCVTVSVWTSVCVSLRYRYRVIVLGQTGAGGSTQGEHDAAGSCGHWGHVGLLGQFTIGQVTSLQEGHVAGLVGWMHGDGVSIGLFGQTGQSGGVGKSGEDGVSGQIGQLVATGTRMAVK